MDGAWYAIPKPSVAVDVVAITTATRQESSLRSAPSKGILILLTKANTEVYTNKWVLPGGFVGLNETLIDTCHKKLCSKSGISNIRLEQVHTYGDKVDRDPRGHVISVGYMAAIQSPESIEINKDTSEWFWLDRLEDGETNLVGYTSGLNLSGSDIGFDHINIINDTLERLSKKLLYSDIGFHLLPSEFTINELQQCFELICRRSIPGFRRLICERVQEVPNKFRSNGYRPAKLYSYKGEVK